MNQHQRGLWLAIKSASNSFLGRTKVKSMTTSHRLTNDSITINGGRYSHINKCSYFEQYMNLQVSTSKGKQFSRGQVHFNLHVAPTAAIDSHGQPFQRLKRSFSTIVNGENRCNPFEYQQMDFFEEPISFLPDSDDSQQSKSGTESESEEALLAFDTHLIQLLSKGKASNDGGDEFGIAAKAAHSTAITWADLIRHLASWCTPSAGESGGKKGIAYSCNAPMLAVAVFSPLLIHGGAAYFHNIDENYARSQPSFSTMVQAAIDRRNDKRLSRREALHLWALYYLINSEHAKALAILSQLLDVCPGDALGLSFAMDLAENLGDDEAAFRCASSAVSYWTERGQRNHIGQTSIAGHSIGMSLIATGLAIGGRTREAEQLADKSLARDASGASGVASGALAHVYHGEGRTSEGASTFTGHGTEFYESCGFLFFDAKMGGLGSRFVMDRSGASADRVAMRLYDEHFARVMEYSGYDGSYNGPVFRRVPSDKKQMLLNTANEAAKSIFGNFFGSSKKESNEKSQKSNAEVQAENFDDGIIESSKPRSLEDILTWLPPTVNMLVDATFLLFRLTVGGVITTADPRWGVLKRAWERVVEIEQSYLSARESAVPNSTVSTFSAFPLARVASSLVVDTSYPTSKKRAGSVSDKIEEAVLIMGTLMRIKRNDQKENGVKSKKDWTFVVHLLNEARSGWEAEDYSDSLVLPKRPLILDLNGFDIGLGYFLEHAICYAALKSEDYASLCIARSLCSESVALRANSPENWFRYGVILEKLGDEENAKDAFHASISLCSGEGGQVGHQR